MKGTLVTLGPLTEADSPSLWEWINDRDLVVSNAPYRPVHEAAHDEWFAHALKRQDLAMCAIRTGPDKRLIGVCQLHSIHPVHRSAELQIRIGDGAWRGKGCGREAVTLLLAMGFRDLNLRRIYLHVLASNVVAIRLYEQAGFVHEGVLREAAHVNGKYEDLLVMAILKHDYVAREQKAVP
jgi:RimJ/RimL family protein N-acetyltransferase